MTILLPPSLLFLAGQAAIALSIAPEDFPIVFVCADRAGEQCGRSGERRRTGHCAGASDRMQIDVGGVRGEICRAFAGIRKEGDLV